MTGRRTGIIGGGIAVALLVLMTGVLALSGDGGAEDSGEHADTAIASVVRADLVSRRVIDGALGYQEVGGGLVARAAGRVTDLQPEGAVVAPGHALYALDGAPVLLLAGDQPITRDLVLGTRGSDVARLNDTLDVDGDVFTTSTADALRAAQEAAGATPTGVLRPDHAVVLPGAARVGSHEVIDGDDVESGDEIAGLTIDELVVVVELDAGERDTIAAGDEVVIELPSGDEVPGTIRSVASVADEGEGEGDPETIEVIIVLADPAVADGLTGASVDVSITDGTAADVLAVPVTALVALAEGGYGVEVVGAGGNRLVGVEIGMFSDADDLVEITGDLDEGDEVVVPA